MASSEFQRFERSLRGVEGPEYLHVWAGQLTGAEQASARQTLLGMLDDPGTDGRLPRALAAVAPDHFETFDALERAVASKVSAVKLGAMQALAAVTGVSNVPALTRMLAETPSATVRQEILAILAKEPSGRSACLDAMILDDHRDVRTAAFDGLLLAHRLDGIEGAAPNILSMMGMRVRSSLVAVRREAAEQLREALTGLDQDQSPIQLGLRVPKLKPEADRLRNNLLDASAELDEAGLQAMRGESQRWLQDLALGLLDRGDPRIPTALVALRARRAKAALVEWHALVGDADKAWVKQAISQLGGA